MAKKSAPFGHYPAWTEARFWGFLRSALRQASGRWPPKYEAMAAARRTNQSDNKRMKWEFQCAQCKQWFPQKQVQVDHIVPAGSLRTWEDLAPFVQRTFVGIGGFQVLCLEDHKVKTQAERKAARE